MKTLHLTTIISGAVIAIIVMSVLTFQLKPEHQTGVYQYLIYDYYPDTSKSWGTDIIKNQTFHFIDYNMTNTWSKPSSVLWYDINFTFPNGLEVANTPGGGIFESFVTFPDDAVPYRMAIGFGLNGSNDRPITVLSTHSNPQAGYVIYHGTIRLLVNWPKVHTELTVNGFNGTYKTGQPIDFQIESKGFDYFDDGQIPDLWIEQSDGKLVWDPRETNGLRLCCVAELKDYDKTFNFTSFGGPININQTGLYKLHVSYNHQTIEQQFTVISIEQQSKTLYKHQ